MKYRTYGNMVIETIGELKHALDLVREYCGDDLSNYLSEYISDYDMLSDDVDEMFERLCRKNDLMENLFGEMESQLYKYEHYTDDEIMQLSTDQIKEMIGFFSTCLNKLQSIQKI